MLFTWGPVWQALAIFIGSLILYGLVGYELSVIMLLAILVAKNLHN